MGQAAVTRMEESRRIYAFVDSVVEAIEEEPRSRTSIQLDAVDANAFDATSEAIGDSASLLLARISTTTRRLSELFGMEAPKEGDWLEAVLQKSRGMPRAWRFPSSADYEPEPISSAVELRRLDEPSEIVSRLEHACAVPDVEVIDASSALEQRLAIAGDDLRVTALDVGQAACVAFSNGSNTFGYFDVGAPMFFNRNSFPRHFDHRPATDGFVILSHWDFDHFALARKYPLLKALDWFAPRQPVGPNTARFQRELGPRLKFISGELNLGKFEMKQCLGTSTRDRNSTGYAMRVAADGAGILLPGDADHQWIPPALSVGITRLMMPHHGGTGSLPPHPTGGGTPIAVASYGVPNTYRHPDENLISSYQQAGWRIRRTAQHGRPPRPRGNRVLHPT